MAVLRAMLLLLLVPGAAAFAAWMVDEFCDRALLPGAVVMNELVQQSDQRHVRVHRSHYTESGERVSEEVLGGGFFPGEELVVSVSDDPAAGLSTEFLFETSGGGARFLGHERGCHHTRTNVNNQVLTMPQFKTTVKLWVGWAAAHGVVKVSPTLELQPAIDLSSSQVWSEKPIETDIEEENDVGLSGESHGGAEDKDKDEEEYHFPEDLVEYLLFSQLGPVLVVLVVVLAYLFAKKVSGAFSRRGSGKDL